MSGDYDERELMVGRRRQRGANGVANHATQEKRTYRAQILGVLEFRFDADIVDPGVQNTAQVSHDVLRCVQEDRLG